MDSLFNTCVITKRCSLPVVNISSNIQDTLLQTLKNNIEGVCINEGFIKKDSIVILTHSFGVLDETNVVYDVVFECLVCYPVDDSLITCTIENITKAGVKAFVSTEDNPVIVFAARDLHLDDPHFNDLIVGQTIVVQIVGSRFEQGDKFVSVIAKYVNQD